MCTCIPFVCVIMLRPNCCLVQSHALTTVCLLRSRFGAIPYAFSMCMAVTVSWNCTHKPFHVHMQLVGPILCAPAKPLPQNVSRFLEQDSKGSTKRGDGAVYVSMGLSARLDYEQLYCMAQSLSKIPNPVLWQLPSSELLTVKSFDLNSNIMVVDRASRMMSWVTQLWQHLSLMPDLTACMKQHTTLCPWCQCPYNDQIHNAIKVIMHKPIQQHLLVVKCMMQAMQ